MFVNGKGYSEVSICSTLIDFLTVVEILGLIKKNTSLLFQNVNNSFIVADKDYETRLGASVIKLFCPLFTNYRTNLECFIDKAGKACQGQTL